MKHAWAVAKLTFSMLVRRGYGLWLIAVIALVTLFIYGVCRADGVLAHELQLRSRYALTIGTSLLGVCLLWIACVSMRGDIEAKRLHLLTSYPLRRVEIFAGKWLGLLAYGALGLLVAMGTVGAACLVTMARWPAPDEVAALRAQPSRVYEEVAPVTVDIAAETERRLNDRLSGQTPPDEPTLRRWRTQIRDQIRKEVQLVKPNGEKTWTFHLGEIPRHDDHILLRYRYYSSDRRAKVNLHWKVRGETTTRAFEADTSNPPFTTNTLDIPADVVPPDGNLTVTVTGSLNPELVFYQNGGLSILYRGGPFWMNVVNFFLAILVHFGAMISVGFLIGIAFTTSVASFVSAVLYFLALTSSFFQGFLRDLATSGDGTKLELLSRAVIRIGTFFTTGLEPPGVISPLADWMAITPDNLGMAMTRWLGGALLTPIRLVSESAGAALHAAGIDLALGYLVYFALATALGIRLLTRKELDRVH